MDAQIKNQTEVGIDLTEGGILKSLLIFVVPLLLANIIQQLYNTVDMAFVGQFVGNNGTVGVSNGGEVATLVTFAASGFASAGQIYVSQLAGAKDGESISDTIITALLFIGGLSISLSLLCIALCDVFLGWLNCPMEAVSQARNYMLIVSLGLPFILGYNMICGLLRGMGESKGPLLFISIAALTNVFLDILLVAVIPMEAMGSAIATVLSQIVSFSLSFAYLYRKRTHFGISFSKKHFYLNGHHLKVLLKLGIPLSAHAVFIHFSQIICMAHINTFGIVASAANSIGNKIQKLVNIVASSVTNGAGAMVGQNIGARKYDRVRRIVYTTLTCSLTLGILACGVSIFIPRQVFGIFTKDPKVMDLGTTFLHISILVFLSSPIMGSYQSVITGSGNAKLSFVAGMLDGVLLRLGLSFLLAYTFEMGVTGFFLGNAMARFAPIVISVIYFYSGRWKNRKLLSER